MGIKCSRVVLALAAVALASGDLADDFNIPEGWRMEVNSIYAFGCLVTVCLFSPLCSLTQAQQGHSSSAAAAAGVSRGPPCKVICVALRAHAMSSLRAHAMDSGTVVLHCSAACNRSILNRKTLRHILQIVSSLSNSGAVATVKRCMVHVRDKTAQGVRHFRSHRGVLDNVIR